MLLSRNAEEKFNHTSGLICSALVLVFFAMHAHTLRLFESGIFCPQTMVAFGWFDR
jgi:hypothetical protein